MGTPISSRRAKRSRPRVLASSAWSGEAFRCRPRHRLPSHNVRHSPDYSARPDPKGRAMLRFACDTRWTRERRIRSKQLRVCKYAPALLPTAASLPEGTRISGDYRLPSYGIVHRAETGSIVRGHSVGSNSWEMPCHILHLSPRVAIAFGF